MNDGAWIEKEKACSPGNYKQNSQVVDEVSHGQKGIGWLKR
jgi:hypothetical protein